MYSRYLRYALSMVFLLAAVAVVSGQTKTTFSNIDQMSAWDSCDVCSGAGGAGKTAVHWYALNQTTPAVDGSAAQFYFGGPAPYSSALWWKQLGKLDTASHFVYDLRFYFTDAAAPQALEFDVNQSLNGKKYVFGTECDLRGTYKGYWRIWDATLRWQNTGVPCTGVTANTWHRLTWEFERTADGRTHFINVTLDGITQVVNRYYTPLTSSARELNVAFQTDGNKYGTPYSVWLDKVTLIAW